MKKLLLLFIFSISCSLAFSQITFERDTTHVSGTVYAGQTLELNVYGTNSTGSTKTFVWTVETITTPGAWVTALCTFPGNCYNITVGFTDSFNIGADSQVLIRVDYTTQNTCGSGFVKVNVSPSDDLRTKQALYFVGDAFCASIADQKESDALVKLYPNPADNSIHITSPLNSANIIIYNALGVKMDEFSIDNTSFVYDVARYTTGNYYVVIKDNNTDKTFVKEFSKN